MLKEMRGYAEAASFNAAGRHAARSALSNFLKTAQMLNANASLSQVGCLGGGVIQPRPANTGVGSWYGTGCLEGS